MGSDKEESGGGLFFPVVHVRAKFEFPVSDVGVLASPQLGNHSSPLVHSDLAYLDCSSGSGLCFEVLNDITFEHTPMLTMAYKECKDDLHHYPYADGMETMGQRIRLLRQARGLTQQQLGDHLGVSKVAVSQWETGSTENIRLKTFLALVDLLGTKPEYLIFGPEKPGQAAKRRMGG
jgi:DNA-binding XRE family transcriptional regulator